MEAKLTFKEYNENLKQGRLSGLKCGGCGELSAQPRLICAKCGGQDFEAIEFKGGGAIQTFTVNYVPAEGRESEAPYIVVIVELDDGPWVMGNLAGLKPDEAGMDIMGRKVRLEGSAVFAGDKYSAGEIARPVFRLV
ncbi:MAG: Zn-ribbon domain-containing OB-fold protein [Dehalococcoidia bacterium]|nr:Zn-ribbon domain-containing OB-fold protein [Dehalococcoidia bacterium]